MSRGIGQFFHPKPNRLIVNSGILHKINQTTKKSSDSCLLYTSDAADE